MRSVKDEVFEARSARHGFLRRVLRFLPLLTITLILGAQGRDVLPVGFVAETNGNWVRVRDKKLLEVHDEIFSNTTVRTEISNVNSINWTVPSSLLESDALVGHAEVG